MQLVMVTQYFDTLKSIGENDKTNTLFLSLARGCQGGLGSDSAVHVGGGESERLNSLPIDSILFLLLGGAALSALR